MSTSLYSHSNKPISFDNFSVFGDKDKRSVSSGKLAQNPNDPPIPTTILTRPRPVSTGQLGLQSKQYNIRCYAKNSKDVWIFTIDVESTKGSFSNYSIHRRFNDFQLLHYQLTQCEKKYQANKHVSFESLPSLPECGLISNFRLLLHDEKWLKNRIKAMQEMLNAIQMNPSYNQHQAFSKFIGRALDDDSAGYVSLNLYRAPEIKLTHQVYYALKRKRSRTIEHSLCHEVHKTLYNC